MDWQPAGDEENRGRAAVRFLTAYVPRNSARPPAGPEQLESIARGFHPIGWRATGRIGRAH